MRKKSFREVIGYEPVSCRTVDPGGTGGSKCNTASRGYQRCYSEARPVSLQPKYTTGDRRAVDAYNEEEVMPMKAAPKVVWMSTFFILEKERKNKKGKKRETTASEAAGRRRERDRLGRPSALIQPFAVVGRRQIRGGGRRGVFTWVGSISTGEKSCGQPSLHRMASSSFLIRTTPRSPAERRSAQNRMVPAPNSKFRRQLFSRRTGGRSKNPPLRLHPNHHRHRRSPSRSPPST